MVEFGLTIKLKMDNILLKTNLPTFQHSTIPLFHYSTIPLFHYSIIPYSRQAFKFQKISYIIIKNLSDNSLRKMSHYWSKVGQKML